jgi:hypothetical protein
LWLRQQEAGIMMTKKLLIDLWASATSHLLVAEWLPYMPNWVEPGLVIILSAIVLVLLFHSKGRHRRESKPRWTFSLSRGPNGIKWTAAKRKDEPGRELPKPRNPKQKTEATPK